VFRYAIASARAENDPTGALKGALTRPVVTARPAITDRKALGGLLRAVDGFDGQPTTREALKLLAILAPRPGELRLARWTEFDLEAAVWTIPAERTKMRREHRAPLPRQAVDILRRLHSLTGGGELVFPSVRSNARPISENTLNAALRRMGYASDEVTSHGFRATFSTIANESRKWNADAIERVLAHVENDGVRRAYHRAEYWDVLAGSEILAATQPSARPRDTRIREELARDRALDAGHSIAPARRPRQRDRESHSMLDIFLSSKHQEPLPPFVCGENSVRRVGRCATADGQSR
jgi:integrase